MACRRVRSGADFDQKVEVVKGSSQRVAMHSLPLRNARRRV